MTARAAHPPSFNSRHLFIGAVWLSGCLAAFSTAMRYDFNPGRLGPPLIRWPEGTALTRTPGRETVVAFLHPRCVCTRASVTQLVRTLQRAPQADLIVSVFVPPAEPAADRPAWETGEYVQAVRQDLPQARVVFDEGGVEARRFGALTSGTMLVYSGDGREVFRGGITNRRGGEDDNPGLRRFARAVTDAETAGATKSSPVFGCPLIPSDAAHGRR